MALNEEKKTLLDQELTELRYYELNEANKKHADDKNRFHNFERYQNVMRREKEFAEDELKVRETASFNLKQMVRTENLARELEKIKREELKELKMRQLLRENCHELRELESQLRSAYVSKELAAQLAEKEAEKLRNKIEDKQAFEILQNTWLKQDELRYKEQEKEIRKKAIYKQELQDQMILKEQSKRYLYEEFLLEKKMIDDIVQRIHDEDEREIEERMCKMMRTRQEMDAFKKAQQIWRQREKEELELENRRIQEFVLAKATEMQSREEKKNEREEVKARLTEKIAKKMADEEAKRKEREDILMELQMEELKHAIEQRHKDEVEKSFRQRIEVRESLMRQMMERQDRLRRDAEEDAAYKDELITKMMEDERLEQLSAQRKRMKMLQLRRDVEEMMIARRQKRAEEMQVLMKLMEDEERERRERRRVIEEERLRMLKEHANNLIGYLPRGVLRADDLPHLGSNLARI